MHDCCECCVMKHAIGHADPCARHQRGAPKITGHAAARKVQTVELPQDAS